jgi:hypothetical protein
MRFHGGWTSSEEAPCNPSMKGHIQRLKDTKLQEVNLK